MGFPSSQMELRDEAFQSKVDRTSASKANEQDTVKIMRISAFKDFHCNDLFDDLGYFYLKEQRCVIM